MREEVELMRVSIARTRLHALQQHPAAHRYRDVHVRFNRSCATSCSSTKPRTPRASRWSRFQSLMRDFMIFNSRCYSLPITFQGVSIAHARLHALQLFSEEG